MQPNYQRVIDLAKQAGAAILDIYHRSEYTAVEKLDSSPLTEADIAANRILTLGLKAILDFPIISEEADVPELSEREQWPQFWLIDPLDGTKEFIDRNGEFCICIALISHGEPVFGLIYSPVTDECYYGGEDKAYLKIGEAAAIRLRASKPTKQIREAGKLRIFASKRHSTPNLERLIDRLEEKVATVSRVDVGSALKIAFVAAGQGELYPRYGNVSEWDIAAGHAILRCVGGDILSLQYEPIRYGRKRSMIVPGFFAIGCIDFDWRPLLIA